MGFRCSKKDMRIVANSKNTQHYKQEAEANTFAIELLAPAKRMKFYTRSDASLKHVLTLAKEFEISKEAAARRYVQFHGETLAIVFSKDNCMLYTDRAAGFPWIGLAKNQRLSLPSTEESHGKLIPMEDVEPSDRSINASGSLLTAQTYFQQDGYAMTLLSLEDIDEDNDPGFDDAFDRFSR